jgi:hypothetical protein
MDLLSFKIKSEYNIRWWIIYRWDTIWDFSQLIKKTVNDADMAYKQIKGQYHVYDL